MYQSGHKTDNGKWFRGGQYNCCLIVRQKSDF